MGESKNSKVVCNAVKLKPKENAVFDKVDINGSLNIYIRTLKIIYK